MSLILSGTDGLSDVDGTAATPAIRGTDANTGIFFPAADTIGFSEGGVEAARINADSQFVAAAGTAALPVITTTGDTNTGIFFPAADTIAFAEGGAEVARFDSSGNFGLGVTPNSWGTYSGIIDLKGNGSVAAFNQSVLMAANAYYNGTNFIYKATTSAGYYQIAGNQFQWYQAASGTAGNAITFTQAMTLDASGNLLVGTTSTNQSHRFIGKVQNAWTTEFFAPWASNNYGISVNYTAAAPRTTGFWFYYAGDTGGQMFGVASNGGIYNYTANDINLSDRREKTNFAPAGDYLSKICAIPVQTFNYIDQNMEDDGGLTLGVVAQDVQTVAPELVMESNWAGKDEEPKMRLGIYQTDLQYALMKCIQEQQALIQTLAARITALESA